MMSILYKRISSTYFGWNLSRIHDVTFKALQIGRLTILWEEKS